MSKILLIEDDPQLQNIYRTVLTNGRHEVVVVNTTAEAETLLDSTTFDLMLCDIHIHNGLKLEWLHTVKDRVGRTVVLSTENSYRQRCQDLDLDLFMETPVSNALLLSMINRLTRFHDYRQPSYLGN